GGRSLSMATFLANAAISLDAFGMKLVNLGLHLTCGLLLFWLILLILETEQPRSRTNRLLALFVASAWLLHPLLSSTVLYVVQRMTQLSALFTLLALISYIAARRALPKQHRKGLLLLF